MHSTPDGLPILSRGRHRRPRDGACAMELVSVLAGERWSDAPVCTHPLLGRLARLVNDAMSDAGRQVLARQAPALVGLTGPDPLWHLEIALAVATRTLRVAAPWDQGPLAAAVLTCERDLAVAAGYDRGRLRPSSAAALTAAPDAAEWARRFTAVLSVESTDLPGASVVPFAVRAVLDSGTRNLDAELSGLLGTAVEACLPLREDDSLPVLTSPGAPARSPAFDPAWSAS